MEYDFTWKNRGLPIEMYFSKKQLVEATGSWSFQIFQKDPKHAEFIFWKSSQIIHKPHAEILY